METSNAWDTAYPGSEYDQQAWGSQSSGSMENFDLGRVLVEGVPRWLDSWAGVVRAENTKPQIYTTGRAIPYGTGTAYAGNNNVLLLLLAAGAVLFLATK